MKNKNNSILQIVLLIGIAVLCAYSYHPRFFDLSSGSITNQSIVRITELVIIFLALISIKKVYCDSTLKVYFWCMIFVLLFITSFISVDLDASFSAALSILLPLFGIIIGQNLRIDKHSMIICLRAYMMASVVIGFSCIMRNLGAFVIVDQYAVAGKNASGAMLGISGCIALYLALQERKILYKCLDISCLILCLVEILTMRARLATLGLILLLCLILLRSNVKIKATHLICIIISIVTITLVAGGSIEQFVYDSFFQNKERDLTSGRTDLNKAAFDVILKSPFLGNLRGDYIIDDTYQVHNFLLNTISHYGLFFSLPWVVIYIKIALTSLFSAFKYNVTSNGLTFLSNTLMLYLLWESLGEYTYPFGPGTITFIPFLLWGWASTHTDSHKGTITH